MEIKEQIQNQSQKKPTKKIVKFSIEETKDLICTGYIKRKIEISKDISVELHTLSNSEFISASMQVAPKDVKEVELYIPILTLAIDKILITHADGVIEMECDTPMSKNELSKFLNQNHLYCELMYTQYINLLNESFEAIKLQKKN